MQATLVCLPPVTRHEDGRVSRGQDSGLGLPDCLAEVKMEFRSELGLSLGAVEASATPIYPDFTGG